MNLDGLDLSILGPAFAAGLLVLTTHVPLGVEVLRRGIIFIDLAVAQVAGLGVIGATAFGWPEHGLQVQVAAVSAALLAGFALNWSERRWPTLQEPLIGILFVLAATGGILLLAENPHAGDYLKDLLVGQILWSTWSMLLPVAALYLLIVLAWLLVRDRAGRTGFYLAFVFAITASVQIVGVYLVFASLIVPAIATVRLSGRRRLIVAYTLGTVAYAAGITVSALTDLPTGALTVWTMAILGGLTAWLIGRYQQPAAMR